VTFEVEQIADAMRLTVTHEDFEPGSDMLRSISHGWPLVLSSLKSLLETGKAYDDDHDSHGLAAADVT
jgi:hypothetical protein